ncbi:cytochrome B [Pleomorphomonas diazotrophica]|uniref:Cytochrome B n=1 Tax=Pleomorphomonas diazotrophica TaxID=1166257 RepID=A0A1I4T9Z5_9HYPH|nr:cytochrome b [Pleomorphomonas diazotrophica]PKR89460.1 cytochrome B [Pleomorphomonas diazotrophica]SFM73618.1 cytochrome b561 [Pleomorphomonas diazotrophica]
MAKQSTGYTALQLSLHWLIVLLVFFQLIFGEDMGHYNEVLRSGQDVAPLVTGYYLHVGVGVAVLALTLFRLGLRFRLGVPASVPGPALQVKAGEALHYLFYLMLIVTPITGLLAQYVDMRTFGEVHEAGKPIFILLILIHAAAALYHHFVLKDATLRRMMVPGTH